ncbi:hypothetical protein AMATHDRAFT_61659 [Amanita thiersii Skay4041]|uniref:BTB domain-containing protein n=1 Tax=Amanita thiersii Skay4041 TaxID=703135 RepID=A0A2A9NPI6_9AGAR|nr:hypothetical protein AMATHDRAFT_61659 [Amanita thiersii Skay4041]
MTLSYLDFYRDYNQHQHQQRCYHPHKSTHLPTENAYEDLDEVDAQEYPVYDFTSSDADVILVSGEKGKENEGPYPRQFRVHKCILGAASPFFNDMFSLPEPVSNWEGKREEMEEALPVIPVTETKETLDLLLRFLYPIPNPRTDTLALPELVSLIAAAQKYDFPSVLGVLRALLVSPRLGFLAQDPLRVYAVACRFGLEREAREASRWTLRVNVIEAPLEEELKWVSAWSYHRLLGLHWRRAKEAREVVERWYAVVERAKEEGAGSLSPPKCVQCNGSPFTIREEPKWWVEFVKRAKEILGRCPTTEGPMELGGVGGGVFGMTFLEEVVKACGCPRCAGSVLGAGTFLKGLKDEIDRLPDTV